MSRHDQDDGRVDRAPASPPPALRPAFRMVRWLRWLAPSPRRRSWEQEWKAELYHAWQVDGSPTAVRFTRRALAAVPHALALRRQRWSLDLLGQDVRYAVRALAHAPAFTAVAVATLALAIGANVAIFGVVHSLLLDPFPVPHGNRLVYLWRAGTDQPVMVTPSAEDIAAWREQAVTLDAVEPVSNASVTSTGGERPQELVARRIGPGFLPMLGVEPLIGRNFTEAEAQAGDDAVTLLSYGYWQRRFGGARDVVGSELEIDDHVAVVVGVLPRTVGLHLFEAPDLWLPAPPVPQAGAFTLGRMAPGVGVEAVREELEAIARRQAGDSEPQWVGLPRPAQEMLGGNMRTAILVLQGAVVFVLLIAGANIANLMLARGTVQRRELAIRAALGAGRTRLIRQLVTETTLLALAGGAVGLVLARLGLGVIQTLRPGNLVQLEMVRFDPTTVGFGVALAVGAGLLFGLIPAVRLARPTAAGDLQESLERSSLARGGSAVRRTLVVVEVALAFMLLVGAGLMVHSFLRLQAADPGFDTEGLMAMQLELPADRYPDATQRHDFAEILGDRVRSALGPGISGLAIASSMPGTAGIVFGEVHVEGVGEPLAPGASVSAAIHAGPGYFRTTRIPLLRGRAFTEEDLAKGSKVAVVSESFAQTHFPGGSAVGERFGLGDFVANARSGLEGGEGADWIRVIGVVADAKQLGLTAGSSGDTQVYFPYRGSESLALILRTGDRPLQHAETLREQVWALDPDLPIRDLAAGRDLLGNSFESPRFQTALMSTFAGVAVLLALIGVYGVLMYAVTQRVHEIGVRMALGARAGDVLGLVARQGVALVGIGLALGLLGGLSLSRYLGSLLYELEPTDPVTFGLTAVALCVVGLAAMALPAARATRVDPLVALREE